MTSSESTTKKHTHTSKRAKYRNNEIQQLPIWSKLEN